MESLNINDNISQFFLKKKNIIKFFIIPFLEQDEKFTCRNINTSFFKAYKEYLSNSTNKINEMISNRRVELEFSNDQESIIESIKNKTGFHIKNTKANYMQFFFDTYQYLALTREEVWAHYNNPSYWYKVKLQNSTFGGETYYLKDVCWLDLNINFNYVIPAKYEVYLRQGFKESLRSLENGLTLKIIVEYTDSNEDSIKKIELYKTDFMSREMIKSLKEETLMDSLITQIDLSNLPIGQNDYLKVKLAFFQKNGYWKSGWYIDGAILKRFK